MLTDSDKNAPSVEASSCEYRAVSMGKGFIEDESVTLFFQFKPLLPSRIPCLQTNSLDEAQRRVESFFSGTAHLQKINSSGCCF